MSSLPTIAILTAPRVVPTLDATVRSLRNAGFHQVIHVFAEPGAIIPRVQSDLLIHHNAHRLGARANFQRALVTLLSMTDACSILCCEDDVEFAPNAAQELTRALNMFPLKRVGYLSLFTCAANWHRSGQPAYDWWPAPDRIRLYGALAWCLPRASVVHAIEAISGSTEEGTDTIVSEELMRRGFQCFFHTPSLARHIGITSTQDHFHKPANEAVGWLRTPMSDPRGALAAVTTYINPAGFGGARRRYERFAENLRRQEVPLFTVEVAIGNRPFELTGTNVWQLRARDVLWLKEAAINVAIRRLPSTFTDVAWLDRDILFRADDWAVRTTEALRTFPIVQPFDVVNLLDDADIPFQRRPAFAASFGELASGRWPHHAGTGYAWAARREVLGEAGLFDEAIIGGGDVLFAATVCGWVDAVISFGFWNSAVCSRFRAWAIPLSTKVASAVGVVPGTISHLWHGHQIHRQYIERHALIKEFDPMRDLRRTNDGLFEWSDDVSEHLRQSITEYFWMRREDAASNSVPILPDAEGISSVRPCLPSRSPRIGSRKGFLNGSNILSMLRACRTSVSWRSGAGRG